MSMPMDEAVNIWPKKSKKISTAEAGAEMLGFRYQVVSSYVIFRVWSSRIVQKNSINNEQLADCKNFAVLVEGMCGEKSAKVACGTEHRVVYCSPHRI